MLVRADFDFIGSKSFLRRWVTPITVSAALLSLTTAFVWMVDAPLQHDHLIFIYLVPTALIAIRYGSISAMCVAIVSTFAAAYFLYAPRFSLMVASPLDLLELILFSLLALLASQVVSGFANDSDVEKRRERVPAASWGAAWRARWPSAAALWDRLGR
jgi:two-component system sensor histidine kinase KdpD